MIVYVVVSECGMNGAIVHGVYTEKPDPKVVEEFVRKEQEDEGGWVGRVSGITGYMGTTVRTLKLDGQLLPDDEEWH